MTADYCKAPGCTCPDPGVVEPVAIAAAIRAQLQSGIAAALNPAVFAHALIEELRHLLERIPQEERWTTDSPTVASLPSNQDCPPETPTT